MKDARRSILIAGTLLFSSVCAAQAPADVDVPRLTFNIQSQRLDTALTQFAQTTGLQLLFPTNVAMDRTAPKVSGSLTPEMALQILLKDSGLSYQYVNAKTVAIRTKGTSASGAVKQDNGMQEIAMSSVTLALEDAERTETRLSSADKDDAKKKARDASIEEMIVETGRIKPFSDANVDIPRTVDDVQPYYIFDSATIQKSGAFNIEEFLKQRLTMNTVARTNSQLTSNNTFSGDTSSINLRGLGADKTLVLINGRRMASARNNSSNVDFNEQMDLNGISLSAIERIEVMPSSASGIYGGNALGGVVNVILKRDYVGGEVRAIYQNTWNSDTPSRTANATYGFSVGKNRVMLTAQWADSKPMLLQDRRELFQKGLNTILKNSPAFIYSSTEPFLGALPNVTSAGDYLRLPDGSYDPSFTYIPDPGTLTLKNGTPLNSRATYISAGITPGTSQANLSAMFLANAGKFNLDLPLTKQNPTGLLRELSMTPKTSSFMASFSRELRPGTEMTLDLSRTNNDSYYLRSDSLNGFTVPVTSPYNPFNSAVYIKQPTPLTTPNISDSYNDSVSLGFTARQLPLGWTAHADYSWSRGYSQIRYASPYTSQLINDISAGTINPFADLLAYPLTLDEKYMSWFYYQQKSTVNDIALRGSGPLMSLPWGVANLAVSLQHRLSASPQNEWGGDRPYDTTASVRGVTFPREQAVDSVYAEALIPLVRPARLPLLKSLELQLSGRGERYKIDTGTTGVQQTINGGPSNCFSCGTTRNGQPFFSQTAYTSTSKTIGLKYQPLQDMVIRMSTATAFLPPTGNQLLKNPLPNNPSTVIDRRTNTSVQVVTISGGNPDLKPQNSRSYNAGVIWEPASYKGLRLNAEYYRIQQFDAIGSLSAQVLIDNESQYQDRIVRNAAGALTFVDTSQLNLYKRDTSGWDLSLDYQVKTGFGDFNIHAVESIVLGLENQYSLTLPAFDAVGFPSESGAAKYKSNLQLGWDYGRWSTSWAVRFFGSYKQNGAVGGPYYTQITNQGRVYTTPSNVLAQGSEVVPSQMYHDLFLSYAFDRGAEGKRLGGSFVSQMLSGTTMQLGIKNVFDKTPPFDVAYDFYISPYGDVRLRSYWLSLSKTF